MQASEWTKIMILVEDHQLRQDLWAELTTCMPTFEIVDDQTNLWGTIIIVDESNLKEEFLKDFASSVFLITNSDDQKNITDFLYPYRINHLFGGNANKLIEEIKNTMIKMSSPSIWGMEHYLEKKATIVTCEIQSSKQINQEINQALESFDFSTFFTSPSEYIKMMANELLTNAFYNIQDTTDNRREEVAFEGRKNVLFQMGLDENYLVISVRDNSGSLGRDSIVKSIERGLREKTVQQKDGGAGIGLYLTFSHSNQMIVNQVPEIGTEVICVIDANKRFKRYKERITSFHFHTQG